MHKNKLPERLDRKTIYESDWLTDENEVNDKKWFSKDEVLDMLKNNEIQCGVSMLALMYAMIFCFKKG